MFVIYKIIEFASSGKQSFEYMDTIYKKYLITIYYWLLDNVLIMNHLNKS